MLNLALIPPVAFLLTLVLVGLLSGLGRVLAGKSHTTTLKATTYASGEAAPTASAVPGYHTFFVIALFFAVLHLGVLMLATSAGAPIAVIYILGLSLALLALMIG